MFYFSRKNQDGVSPYLLLGCENGEVVEYNLKDSNASKSKFFIEQPIQTIFVSVEQKQLFLLTNDQMFIKADYDLLKKSIDKVENVTFTPGYCQEVLDIKIIKNSKNNDGKNFKFLFSSNDNNLKYFDTAKGQIKIYEGHTDFIMTIDVKQNFIATGSKDGTIRLWKFEINEIDNFECSCIGVFKGKYNRDYIIIYHIVFV